MTESMPASILDELSRLFSADGFVPRRFCGRWPAWLVAEHVAGNAMIWIAYLGMSILVWRLARRRPELRPFRGLALSFAFLIWLCGLGHVLDMLAFFRPMYRLSGLVLISAGAASWWTAWAVARAWQRIAAMRSPEELERLVAGRTAELTRAIEDLRRSELDRAHLATMVESSDEAIISKDLDGVVTSWNHGAERLFGYSPAEAIGRPVTFLIPDDRLDEEPMILSKVRAGESVPPFESVRRTKDGRTIDVRLSISPIRDREGRIVGVSKIGSDVTERTRAEAALRDSEGRFRALIETLPQLVWSTGASGETDYLSPQWFAYTGCIDAADLKARWAEILHPDDRAHFESSWGASLARGDGYDVEYRMRRSDGEYRWFKVRGVAIREPDGRIVRWFGTCTDIDDQMRIEEAFRVGEDRQRRALSAARIGHWEFDLDEHRVTYLHGLKSLYGRGDEPPSNSFEESIEFLHPDDRPGVVAAVERALAGDIPLDVEHRTVWPDGSSHWLAARGVVLRDEAGRPTRMVGVNVDITERKEAELQIRVLNEDLERRVRERTAELGQRVRLIDMAYDAIIVRSPGGVISSWNRGAERIYGWSRDEAVGRPSHELLKTRFPRDLAEIEAELEALGSWEGELTHERRDGVRIVVESRWVRDRDASAGGAVLEINTDITDRRAAEEALRRSEAALKQSQRLAGVGSWEWDPGPDVLTWSEELYRIAGRDPDRPPPKVADHAEILAADCIPRLDAALAATLSTGESYEVELDMIGDDGSHRWLVARGEAVRGPGGEVAMLRGTAQDVTARKRFEEELRRARDEAMAATRAKGEFLANMSHEIRTPMNGVIGMTEMLLGTGLDDLQRDYAETIGSSAEALLTVIDDILDFSKIEAGKMTLDVVPFDLRGVVDAVAVLLAPRARQKGIEIRLDVDPSIPARLLGDPVRVRQILLNLAGNAVKFTDRGRVVLEARLVADSGPKAKIKILVRDTGIGIPEAHQAAVFESFTQVEGGSSRRHGGTGLGLTICRSLVALMGGEIGLESRPGEGSTFWFELSLGKERRAEVRAEPGAVAGASLPAPLSILLAEDNEVNRRVAIGMAERLGCRVEAVRDGRQAVEALDYGRHDLILMDVQMPEMDGFAATALIREREVGTGRRMPILAMTAHAMRGDRERCLAAGMDGYIAKPIRPGPLLDALLPFARKPAETGGDDADPLSGDVLEECCGGDPALLDRVLGLALDETPGRLAGLAEAIDSEDGARIYREAHALLGSFLAIGAEAAGSSCRDLMNRGRIGDLAACRAAFRTVRDRWAAVEAELVSRRRGMAVTSGRPPG